LFLQVVAIIISVYAVFFLFCAVAFTVHSQSDLQTIKYRDLEIDLGKGVKTNAQLTLPAEGDGPFPAVLLIHGSGPTDMNATLAEDTKPFWQISQYLTERGFAVLRYDKRGIGEGGLILDANIWGNTTIDDLIEDSKKALSVLIEQPEVDPRRVSLFGHSEGTIIAPRVAIDNSTKVKNMILMGTVAQNARDLLYNQRVNVPLVYAMQVLDKNLTGFITSRQIVEQSILLGDIPPPPLVPRPFLNATDMAETMSGALVKELGGTNDSLSIDKQLRPALIRAHENHTSFNLHKCTQEECPIWLRSHFNLTPTISVIGNVSNSIGILMLNGENDFQTPVQQTFLLQQKLIDANHPDHSIITYPGLGHVFHPSSQWQTSLGPIPQHVLADLYAWLEAHSGISYPYIDTTSNSTNKP
jgi:pimeloyl-ACP methyl ester carboxylesterase